MVIREIPFGSGLYYRGTVFRELILRRPLGLVLSEEDLRGEDQQIHIAAVRGENEIWGMVILKQVNDRVVKLRQMAVAPDRHRCGIGRDLVRFCEKRAQERGFSVVEMHARVSARGFYEKLGYETEGGEFMELGNVPHIKMSRRLVGERF